jgi:hypothetical protein
MSSSLRKVSRRVVVLTFALALGAMPLASAEAAQRSRRDSAIQQAASARTIVQAMVDPLLSAFEKMGWHPGFKPETGTSGANPEGTGVCPNGKPGLQGNPNQTGN